MVAMPKSADGVPARGRADKYRAITRAARTVFGQEGYSRTSIDAIAAEAGVSSRTVYNHFEGKEQLFATILHASSAEVADGFIAKVEHSHLTGTDVTGDLIALGYAFAAQRIDFPEHFSMVEQIFAEAKHFPPAIIEGWQDAGPRRVQREIARCLQQLADNKLLRVSDPGRAAMHFMALTTAGLTASRLSSVPLTKDKIVDNVRAGVDAFLNGYGNRPS